MSRAHAETPDAPQVPDPAPGGRSLPIIRRGLSLQSRLSSLLAIGLMAVVGLGLVGGYYIRVLSQPDRARESAQSASRAKAQGEMPLPQLGPVDLASSLPLATQPQESPPDDIPDAWLQPAEDSVPERSSAQLPPPGKSVEDLLRERQLTGPVYAADMAIANGSASRPDPAAQGDANPRSEATLTPAVRAQVLPTQRLLLAKGAFLDCTLETAIDSTLPGMVTCITATDSFSVDRTVVLMERGTKLVGETRGEVRQGSARVFVLWTEARTPKGIVVPLASPGTDELGRSGLPGDVNRHFFERFGSAILVSVIEGTIRNEIQSGGDGGTVIYSPSASEDIGTEILKSTIDIPPTVVKRNGDRIQVLVARDLDFRSVYELRPTALR